MKLVRIAFPVALLLAGLARRASAQFTAEEIAQRPEWEAFLAKAAIVDSERIGEGVTKPRKLHLRHDGRAGYGVWKRPGGIGAGLTDKWEWEVAAYRLDKLLGLGMVPPTTERSYRLSPGSLQLWAELPMSELKMYEQKIEVPAEKRAAYEKARALQRAFDSLIANSDRTMQNLRYTSDWRMILIDHSRAFRDSYPHVDRLIYGRNGLVMNAPFAPLPRAFVEAVRGLTAKGIRAAVGKYLSPSELKAVMVRRDLLLKEIELEVAEKGEAAVLY